MNMQCTIGSEKRFSGKSLHCGEFSTVVFHPAPVGAGIVFRRVDLPGAPAIPACIDFVNIEGSIRRTFLEKEGVRVHTVEHVLAPLNALGIDNVIIDIDAEEPPSADGSAEVFAELLKSAGIEKQSEEKKFLSIDEPIVMNGGGVEIVALPSDRLEITFFIVYDDNVVGRQGESFVIDEETFLREIAPARTYCFESEIESIRNAGLGKGGSLENTLVITEDGILNDSLRFETEMVRHKILDLLGDLCLLGAPLKAHILSAKSGHFTHIKFVQKLLEASKK